MSISSEILSVFGYGASAVDHCGSLARCGRASVGDEGGGVARYTFLDGSYLLVNFGTMSCT